MQGRVSRVDGWKGIAAFLNVSRTTVITWHRRFGLPIGRFPGSRAVYAYPGDLLRWHREHFPRPTQENSAIHESRRSGPAINAAPAALQKPGSAAPTALKVVDGGI